MADWLATLPEVRALTADVEVGNQASRRLLERLGFTVVGERDGHWQLTRSPA
jgi:RimJ/RimL family protein N-acetyltransferase